MKTSMIISAVAMCAAIGVWMGTVLSTAERNDMCPSTPAWLAAGMQITTLVTSSCEKVLEEMQARVGGQSKTLPTPAWQDPHNNGWYTSQDYGGSFSTSRLTGDGKYIDKQMFTLSPLGVGCKIDACSRSQVRSYNSDDGTNYCNLKMLFCGTHDGCNFVKHDLTFAGETTQKYSQALVNLKRCLGTEPAEEVKEPEAHPERASKTDSEPEKAAAEASEEPSQISAETAENTAKTSVVV